MITILLVDDDTAHNETIRTLLSFEPDFKLLDAETSSEAAVAAAKRLQPDIVLMDVNMAGVDGFATAEKIIEALPSVGVIMLSVQDEASYLRMALSVGARDYLVKPAAPDELYAAIRKAYNRRPKPTAPLDPVSPVIEPGKLVVVYSPQGGAGVTTLAVNLACGLARDYKKVMLIDADLQFGDVSVLLNVQLRSSLFDLLNAGDDLDEELVALAAAMHPSGVRALLPARDLTEALKARENATGLTRLIDYVTLLHDFVVVDTGTYLDTFALALMERASKIVLLGTPSLECAKNLKLVLDYMRQNGIPDEQIAFVLNQMPEDRQSRRTALEPERVESYLRLATAARLPQDEPIARQAVNKGVPLLAFDPKQASPLTRQIAAFADSLYLELIANPTTTRQ